MEATAKSILMDCDGCGELLADFLLDELPESEAVLVHEHLLICPACMKAYRELKGTGKALEAVASMQPITASEGFKAGVRANARIESEKIVAKLPPDKRLRLEARREARQSVRTSRRAPPPKVWSPGLLVLALAAAAVLAAILFWPAREKSVPRVALGKLSIVLGKVDQFYKKENQTYAPAEEGKNFLPGDSFKSAESGRARFDLLDGGSIFLGPSSDATFHFPQTEPGECVILFDSGEAGVFRPETPASAGKAQPHDWEIRSDAGTLSIAPSTHAYFHVIKNDKISTLEVSVLTGCVHAISHDGNKREALYPGQKATLASTDSAIAIQSLTDERPPAWRVDLLNAADLSTLLGAKVKSIARQGGRIDVELVYNHETSNQDWVSEFPGLTLSTLSGRILCPTGIRWKHVVAFAPPLKFELRLSADSRHETSFAFGALETPAGTEVAVDVAHDAQLQVREKHKLLGHDRVAARNLPNAAETLILQFKQEGLGFAATLSTTGGKTKSLPLWKDKSDAPGDLWFQSLGEGLLLDEIKITGTLPVDWVREKMSGAQ